VHNAASPNLPFADARNAVQYHTALLNGEVAKDLVKKPVAAEPIGNHTRECGRCLIMTLHYSEWNSRVLSSTFSANHVQPTLPKVFYMQYASETCWMEGRTPQSFTRSLLDVYYKAWRMP
jgi:hypothetical protein